MKKYYDVDHDKIWTEEELRKDYGQRKRNGELEDFYDTFEYYLESCMTRNNGSLEPIAPDYEIENRRRWTATKIATNSDMKYEDILNVLRKYNVHGTWSMYEIINRPVDYDELQEMVEEELGI
jgi:hypothetical protein